MGRKAQVLIAAVVVFLIGGAVAAYAYDGANKDELAEGVTINGIDVAGMDREQAAETVRNQVLAPQRKPVKVTFKKQTYKLPVNDLNIQADIDSAIDQAFEKSREGSLPGRVIREVTGGSVDARIPVAVTYSKKAVNQFVREVADGVNQDPVDASVAAGPDSLTVVKAADGHKLRDNLLEKQLAGLLDSGEGDRALAAKVNVTKPEVTTAEVASKYPTYLTLDRGSFQLKLWNDLKLTKTYTVAVGQVGLETPAGTYTLQSKQVDPVWTVPNSDWAGDMAGQVVPGGVPENPLKARWMGIFDGAGIHGTDDTASLGSAASHGCVRMSVPDVIDLYDRVDVGTPIYIG
ncbi:MAG TPA: L,D-transpeptidase/peptidoglycan binding protein [Solirubrobacterales bacterium]|nr:L,D-transpeptidase/peptidoglycan binding protein [Solirubrobacterales bacterium]